MRVKVSRILRFVIAAIAFITVGAYIFSGVPHPYFDTISLVWIIAIAFAVYAFSGNFSTRYPEVMIITVSCILYVLFRLNVLMFFPESLLHNYFITPKIINDSLSFIFIGTVACYFGFAFGCGGIPSYRTDVRIGHFTGNRVMRFLVALSAIVFLLSTTQFYSIGWQPSGPKSNLNIFTRYVSVFLDPTSVALLFFIVFSLTDKSRTTIRLLILQVCFLTLGPLLLGSRGGMFFYLIAWLAVKLVLHGDFHIKVNLRGLVIAALILSALVAAFYVSTIFRTFRYSEINWEAIYDVFSDSATVAAVFETALKDISYRVSAIEAVNFTISNRELSLIDVSDIVNVKSTIINTIERIIPGRQFDNVIFSEFAYGYMLRPEGVFSVLEDGQEDPVGYEWNMFGISYQLFGVAGVVFIFLFTALIARLIRKSSSMNGLYGLAWSALFSWLLLAWTQNLGLDNLFGRTFLIFISLTLLVSVVKVWFPKFGIPKFHESRAVG